MQTSALTMTAKTTVATVAVLVVILGHCNTFVCSAGAPAANSQPPAPVATPTPCLTNPCLNGGVCYLRTTPAGPVRHCWCPIWFAGSMCQRLRVASQGLDDDEKADPELGAEVDSSPGDQWVFGSFGDDPEAKPDDPLSQTVDESLREQWPTYDLPLLQRVEPCMPEEDTCEPGSLCFLELSNSGDLVPSCVCALGLTGGSCKRIVHSEGSLLHQFKVEQRKKQKKKLAKQGVLSGGKAGF
eukprot:m.498641 g.498641  ORF g.498641 m.498641 type:complete len:241 (+) comp54778_c0_seq1:249-971(+)